MAEGVKITFDSAQRLSKVLNKDKYQPPKRVRNTRPVDGPIRRRWLGYLKESYRGGVMGFWAVPTVALDGPLPEKDQWVINIFKWNFGVIGATVEVQEDTENKRWIPVNQEYVCDDGRKIGKQTPPPQEDNEGATP